MQARHCEQNVSYWREDPHEVDGVFDGSWGKWAVEVKTGDYTSRDLKGLMEFVRRFPDYRPVVLCDRDYTDTARRVGVHVLPWKEFLWNGLAQ